MQIELGHCNGCQRDDVLIVNKTRGLCEECNFKRLHPDKGSFQEYRFKQQRESLKRSIFKANQLKTKKVLKNISIKKQIKEEAKKKVYEEIAMEREHICTGCRQERVHLSHSHLIPISYDGTLIANKENITYHCISIGNKIGCHEIWESHDLDMMKQLMDFEDNLEKIKKLNINYYNLLTKNE